MEMFPMVQNSPYSELTAQLLSLATYGLHELLLTSVGNHHSIILMEKWTESSNQPIHLQI